MKDFWYYVPTRVNFGPSCFQYLVDTIHQWGTKPLIVYGGGSIKRNGAYDAVVSRLKEAGIPYAAVTLVESSGTARTEGKMLVLSADTASAARKSATSCCPSAALLPLTAQSPSPRP